ncbi:MAG: alkaline phosphatase D family protein, partial [Actinomycetota bacterium]|nr:alkaline phosphatase D family protein [Actinomycetota bacterium]
MDRRTFLQVAAGTAAATLLPTTLSGRAGAQEVDGPFPYGVASGDPLADRLVIWTRVTPTAEAVPGSGLGPDTEVDWEVARDAGFADRVAHGTETARADRDHTVKVDVGDLPAGTELWYRFSALGATSPVGRGRTAPAPGQPVDRLRFGLVSCSNLEGGFFSAYRHLAGRHDLDAVFHLGDYIYEYGNGGYGGANGRLHDPPNEIVTLEDYRRRHACYKADPDLAALHQRCAWVVTIDDHEVANDAWADGAQNHQPGEGAYSDRKVASRQAWFEWMPVREPDEGDPQRLYRTNGYSDLVDLFVLDERSYRSQQPAGLSDALFVTSPVAAEPDRTMLGTAQRTWFEEQLTASEAPWKLVLNSVMFAPLVLTDLPDLPTVTPLLQQVLGGLGVSLPVVINGDQWDGYQVEQRTMVQRYAESSGVVLLTGDIHSSWGAEIPLDPGTYLPAVKGPSAAVEFVVPAVTSDSFSAAVADLGVPGADQLGPLLPTVVGAAAPWFAYLDAERHGFGVLEVTPAQVEHQWFYVTDRLDAAAGLVPGPAFRSPAGSN